MCDKEDYDDRDKVNVDVFQWRALTRNCAALTLAGYNWKVGRGAVLRWWAVWVAERADGRCDFPLALLSCLKFSICRVKRGWGIPSHKRVRVHNNFKR